jgi:type II secretory pathway pseudopilin PulG
MRLLVHALVTLMIAALLGGLVYSDRMEQQSRIVRTQTREQLQRFRQQIDLQMTLSAAGQRVTYPESIDPSWFGKDRPANAMLEPGHPWVEVAGSEDAGRKHPATIVASDKTIAAFWYNPANGVIRARVPVAIRDSQALEAYNEVNDCHLDTLFR